MKKVWLIIGAVLIIVLIGAALHLRGDKTTAPIETPATNTKQEQPAADKPAPYPKGARGYAISWPQCGKEYPKDYEFGIIGVTNGYPSTKNPCFKSELEWAKKGKYPPAFYVNFGYPAGFTNGDDGYHFGYRTASEAHNYAVSQGAEPGVWWLDTQIMSTWSEDTNVNRDVILGAIDYFKSQNLPIGLSTTPYQWNTITDSMQTGLPTWIPGRVSLEQYCETGASYSGGPLQQTAHVTEDDFEAVLACGS